MVNELPIRNLFISHFRCSITIQCYLYYHVGLMNRTFLCLLEDLLKLFKTSRKLIAILLDDGHLMSDTVESTQQLVLSQHTPQFLTYAYFADCSNNVIHSYKKICRCRGTARRVLSVILKVTKNL